MLKIIVPAAVSVTCVDRTAPRTRMPLLGPYFPTRISFLTPGFSYCISPEFSTYCIADLLVFIQGHPYVINSLLSRKNLTQFLARILIKYANDLTPRPLKLDEFVAAQCASIWLGMHRRFGERMKCGIG